ncbi:hypothetical protein [Terrisporobacter sp.]|uniref:hypothetical protein n=1 Tax=Terrisporobacter sp. TaxID=1965305 RepID=UPI00263703F3|nr:hypothetical protein [Terrisporobacter sp.]
MSNVEGGKYVGEIYKKLSNAKVVNITQLYLTGIYDKEVNLQMDEKIGRSYD